MKHVGINEWALTMQCSELCVTCVQTFIVIPTCTIIDSVAMGGHVNILLVLERSLSASAASPFSVVPLCCLGLY